jgi:uncharacterized protein YjeT (DUF2065 family)
MISIPTILITMAAIIILEGLVLTIWPMEIKKGLHHVLKNKKHIRKVGLIEAAIGIILLILTLYLI